MSRLIAIGDLHGYYHTMVDLFNKINIDFNQDKVVFLGDYIDRGQFPIKVLKTVKELQEKHPNNVIALKGNHSDMCIRFYFENNRCWSWNGYETTDSQLDELPEYDREELLQWMRNLPLRYETDEYRFCHSGYWPEGIDEYGYDMCLWDRDWIRYGCPNDDTKPIIFGHTPLKRPTYFGDHLGIDTGVCFGGELTAAIIEDDGITTVSVPVNEEDVV